MSDGVATCKQDKAKGEFTSWKDSSRFWMVETQVYNIKMINPFTRQGAPFK